MYGTWSSNSAVFIVAAMKCPIWRPAAILVRFEVAQIPSLGIVIRLVVTTARSLMNLLSIHLAVAVPL